MPKSPTTTSRSGDRDFLFLAPQRVRRPSDERRGGWSGVPLPATAALERFMLRRRGRSPSPTDVDDHSPSFEEDDLEDGRSLMGGGGSLDSPRHVGDFPWRWGGGGSGGWPQERSSSAAAAVVPPRESSFQSVSFANRTPVTRPLFAPVSFLSLASSCTLSSSSSSSQRPTADDGIHQLSEALSRL
ncbi:hypothetical protein ACHAW5_010436 [Stephanodiscus triporus]|uniref:Uncharacterized protein n=1 Tax=Stephanodiscus triporus TaxID=2934178 RepID=A0ABD3P101_9STRA